MASTEVLTVNDDGDTGGLRVARGGNTGNLLQNACLTWATYLQTQTEVSFSVEGVRTTFFPFKSGISSMRTG